jgi:uncharacterized protein with HEPN domain
MLRHIDLAHEFLAVASFDAFAGELLRVYAATRCLEIISEASRRLSEHLKARHPTIPWKEMAGAGNIYRHDYEDVTAKRVWDTVRHGLPQLRVAVERELGTGD